MQEDMGAREAVGTRPGQRDPEPQSGHGRGRPSCLRRLCLQRWPCLCQECPVPPWGGVSGSWAGSGGTGACGPGALRAEPPLLWTPLPGERLEASGALARGLGWGCACPLLGALQALPCTSRGRRGSSRAGPGCSAWRPAEAGHGSEMPAGPMPAGAAPPGCLLLPREAVGGTSPPHPGLVPAAVAAWASRGGLASTQRVRALTVGSAF